MNDAMKAVKLSEYQAPDFLVDTVYLTFNLHETETKVVSKLSLKRNNPSATKLVLIGEELKLLSLKLNGAVLAPEQYVLDNDLLTIDNVPLQFELEIETVINPVANKTLDGLYKSGTIFCTQNEPEGFRRITYYIDRPDNMAKFTTKIIANKNLYPILLSNGNPIAKGDLANGDHFVEWQDPFKKPSYLFALVAGDLGVITDHFMTCRGRKILLEIYCDKGNESKCYHAMESLKKSMKWDEERFGLEYDLDIFMIVAVDSFNMGAMENKGLNIFNSAYVLANQETATDQNFYGIESVIGHEYFHNWTGNRITCRDWFQLTLKEGLTVYRDQEFSADLNSRVVERINSVQNLKTRQFPEDQGPTSHPIKPESYIEINNFYTMTIYEKGAEVIRMMETLLGRDGFRKGIDKYFELFDGQAVRTEDFIHAMCVANNNFDFTQFKNWYSQNGTPIVHAQTSYDAAKKEFTISLRQELPENAPANAQFYHMPMHIGLISASGKDLPIPQTKFELKNEIHHFVFKEILEKPIASINRNFSAPVKLVTDHNFKDLLFLMAHDSDAFNRYEASQLVSKKIIENLIEDLINGKELVLDPAFIQAYGKILDDKNIDDAFKALSMLLPEEGMIHQDQKIILIKETHDVCVFVKKELANFYHEKIFSLYNSIQQTGEYKLDAKSMGQRELKSKCLALLVYVDKEKYHSLVFQQFMAATNMTEEIGTLGNLVSSHSTFKDEALNKFYTKWKHETLVIQKWLTVQATASSDATFDQVLKLETDAVYDKTVPNLVRALLGSFAGNNLQFNHDSGRGYKLIADRIIELDKLNPQVASRFASQYKNYKRMPDNLKKLMGFELNRITNTADLSKNVYEIVSKILS
jgi:aminopeptidase N